MSDRFADHEKNMISQDTMAQIDRTPDLKFGPTNACT